MENVLQPVLGDDHRSAQLNVDLPDGIQKIRGGNGVQLAGRLVQHQNIRLHGHDGGQIEKLLLSAGQLRHIPVEPALDAEIAGHLRHPKAHGVRVGAQALQTEGQLVPHLVGDDLVIGILHDKADPGRLLPEGNIFQRNPVQQDLPAAPAMGSQHGFQVPQKRCLAAAGLAAQYDIFPFFNGEIHTIQRFALRGGVGEIQILDTQMCHWIISFICITMGISRKIT